MTTHSHTPGPWAWFGNATNHGIYLATTHSGRQWVMGFKRWGMRGAQPMFRTDGYRLTEAAGLLQFEVGNRDIRGVQQAKEDESVYRLDIRDIDSPDARLIAAAPDLLEALKLCRSALGTAQHEIQNEVGKSVIGRRIAEATAAIAKAEGTQ